MTYKVGGVQVSLAEAGQSAGVRAGCHGGRGGGSGGQRTQGHRDGHPAPQGLGRGDRWARGFTCLSFTESLTGGREMNDMNGIMEHCMVKNSQPLPTSPTFTGYIDHLDIAIIFILFHQYYSNNDNFDELVIGALYWLY